MEHKVIQNIKTVTGDKANFRQWHMKLCSAMGQVDPVYESGIQSTVKEIDIGRDIEIVLKYGIEMMGSDWTRLSSDMGGCRRQSPPLCFASYPRRVGAACDWHARSRLAL